MHQLEKLFLSTTFCAATLTGCANRVSEPALDQVMESIATQAQATKADTMPAQMPPKTAVSQTTDKNESPIDIDSLQLREPDEMENLSDFIALESTGAYVTCGEKPRIMDRREVFSTCLQSTEVQKASSHIQSLMKTTTNLPADLQTFGARQAAIDSLFRESHLLYTILAIYNPAISEEMLNQRRAIVECMKKSQMGNIDATYYQDPYLPDDYPPNAYLKMHTLRREAVIPVDVKKYCDDRESWIHAFIEKKVTGTISPARYDMLAVPRCPDTPTCDWDFEEYEK